MENSSNAYAIPILKSLRIQGNNVQMQQTELEALMTSPDNLTEAMEQYRQLTGALIIYIRGCRILYEDLVALDTDV